MKRTALLGIIMQLGVKVRTDRLIKSPCWIRTIPKTGFGLSPQGWQLVSIAQMARAHCPEQAMRSLVRIQLGALITLNTLYNVQS